MPYEPLEPWVVEVTGPNRSYVLPHQYFATFDEAYFYAHGFNSSGNERLTASEPYKDIPAATLREKSRIRYYVEQIEKERANGW